MRAATRRKIGWPSVHPALRVVVIAVLACLATQLEAAKPPKNGEVLRIHWLPLTLDQDYIQQAVGLAGPQGVDAFHLSHTLVHNADDVMGNAERRAHVLEVMRTIKAAGLDIWCWTHELYRLPPGVEGGRFDLRDPRLKDFLQDKYDRFATDILPGLDGIVLTLAETGVKVYQGVSADQARRNVSDLVGILHEPLARHGLGLAVRSFVYKKQELDIVKAATTDMPRDVAVMSKVYPHDWQPYYPINPIIGAIGTREQWVEFDLGFEFEGQNTVPYSDPHGRIRQLNHVWDRGVRTVCLRLDRYHGDEGKSAISTPWGRLNLAVFSAFKRNRNITAEEVIAPWEEGQFPGASKVLAISTAITRRAMFPKKQWYQNHSVIPDYGYARSHLKGGSADRLATWSGLAEDKRAEDFCDEPTPEWYRQILTEDLQNAWDLKRIEAILAENRVDLARYPVWQRGLEALRINVELYAASKRAYFAVRLHKHMPQAMSRDEAAACIDDFERVVRRLDPLPQHARAHKYNPGSTLPRAVESLRRELAK